MAVISLCIDIELAPFESLCRQIIREEIAIAFRHLQPPESGRNTPPQLLSIKEACAYLRICRSTLLALIKNQNIASKKIGGKRFIDQKSIEKYLKTL